MKRKYLVTQSGKGNGLRITGGTNGPAWPLSPEQMRAMFDSIDAEIAADREGFKARLEKTLGRTLPPLPALLVALLVLLLPSLASADTIISGRTTQTNAPFDVSAPSAVSWEVSDDSGHDLTLSVPTTTCCAQLQLLATADTAAAQGIDWAAWSSLLSAPATLHSNLTWNGVTKTGSLVVPDHFALGKLQIWTGNWFWPQRFGSDPIMHISGLATEFVTVPEPASWLLAAWLLFPLVRVIRHAIH